MASLVGVARRAVFWGLTGLVSLAVLAGSGLEANASRTIVTAEVCQSNAQPDITITAPSSDTLLRQSTVTLQGTVRFVNQVDITIDDHYVRTVAIPLGSTAFETNLTLTPGTVTIKAEGVSRCNAMSVSDKIIVTYQPPPPKQGSSEQPPEPLPPSIGRDTPTVTNPEIPLEGDKREPVDQPSTPRPDRPEENKGGVVVSRPGEPSDPGPSSDAPWWRSLAQSIGLINVLAWLEQAFDVPFSRLFGVATGEPVRVGAVIRFIVLMLGLILLVFGRQLLRFSATVQALGQQKRRWLDVSLRLTGLLLILATLVIL